MLLYVTEKSVAQGCLTCLHEVPEPVMLRRSCWSPVSANLAEQSFHEAL